MKDETGNEEKSDSGAQTRMRNITFWRCKNCGGLNKTEERPEVCELCGEGKTFEKMKLKIKTNPAHNT